jgi:hypothetical protein
MNKPVMPVIQSVGPPPTLHAERVAAAMTRWLIEEQLKRIPVWRSIIKKRNDGNPQAQRKFVKRLSEAGGPIAFNIMLDAGKRGRYQLYIHRWAGWDNGVLLDSLDKNGKNGPPIPERPWMAVLLQKIVSKGNGTHLFDNEEAIVTLITHHALARLAERCHAREPKDLLTAANSMSLAVMEGVPPTGDPPLEGWKIPFDTGVAVVRLDDTEQCPLVATVLPL